MEGLDNMERENPKVLGETYTVANTTERGKTKRNQHWEFVRRTFRQVYLVRSFAKIPNRIQGKARPAVSRLLEDSRRKQHYLFLRKMMLEEAFISKTLGIDHGGMCIQHPKQPVCKFRKFDWKTRENEKRPAVFQSCRMCGVHATEGGKNRPAMVTVIGEVRELKSDNNEWKEIAIDVGHKEPNKHTLHLSPDESSDIKSSEGSEDNSELGLDNDHISTEDEWIESIRLRIMQVRSWEDRFALKNHPSFCHYFEMLQSGLSIGAVKDDITTQGYHSSIIDLEPDLPLEQQLGSLSADALNNLRSNGILASESFDDDLALHCCDDSTEVKVQETMDLLLSILRRRRFTKMFALSAVLDANELARRQDKNRSTPKVIPRATNRKDRDHSRDQNVSRAPTKRAGSEGRAGKGRVYRSSSGISEKKNPKTAVRRKPEPSIQKSEHMLKRRPGSSERSNPGTSEAIYSSVPIDAFGQSHERNPRRKFKNPSNHKAPELKSSQHTSATVDTSGHDNPSSVRTLKTMNGSRSGHRDIRSESRILESAVRERENMDRKKLKASHSPDSMHRSITDRKQGKNPRSRRRNSVAEHANDRPNNENTLDGHTLATSSSIKNSTPVGKSLFDLEKKSSTRDTNENNALIPENEDRVKTSFPKKNSTDAMAVSHDTKLDSSHFEQNKKVEKSVITDGGNHKETASLSDTNTTSSSKKTLLSVFSLPHASKRDLITFLHGREKTTKDISSKTNTDGLILDRPLKPGSSMVETEVRSQKDDTNKTTNSRSKSVDKSFKLRRSVRRKDRHSSKDITGKKIHSRGDSLDQSFKSRGPSGEKEGRPLVQTSPLSTSKKKRLKAFFGRAVKKVRRPKPKNENQMEDNRDETANPSAETKPLDSTNPPACSPTISEPISTTKKSSSLVRGKASVSTRHEEKTQCDSIDAKRDNTSGDEIANTNADAIDAFLEGPDGKNKSESSSYEKIGDTHQDLRSHGQSINDILRQELRRKDEIINDLRRQIKEMNEDTERRRGPINSRRNPKGRAIHKPKDPLTVSERSASSKLSSKRDTSSSSSTKRESKFSSDLDGGSGRDKSDNSKFSAYSRADKDKRVPDSKRKPETTKTKRDDSRKVRSTSHSIESLPKMFYNDDGDGDKNDVGNDNDRAIKAPNSGEGTSYDLVFLNSSIQNLQDIDSQESGEDSNLSGYEFDWTSER